MSSTRKASDLRSRMFSAALTAHHGITRLWSLARKHRHTVEVIVKRNIATRLALGFVIALGTMIVVAPAPSPAAAVTCFGDNCSGKDPQSTGCSADAQTIFTQSVYGTGGASWVEIRWSPTCKTNWARSNTVSTNIKAVQDTGYTAGYSNNNGTNSWSGMIYSPVRHVQGCIWGGWGTTCTPWA